MSTSSPSRVRSPTSREWRGTSRLSPWNTISGVPDLQGHGRDRHQPHRSRPAAPRQPRGGHGQHGEPRQQRGDRRGIGHPGQRRRQHRMRAARAIAREPDGAELVVARLRQRAQELPRVGQDVGGQRRAAVLAHPAAGRPDGGIAVEGLVGGEVIRAQLGSRQRTHASGQRHAVLAKPAQLARIGQHPHAHDVLERQLPAQVGLGPRLGERGHAQHRRRAPPTTTRGRRRGRATTAHSAAGRSTRPTT